MKSTKKILAILLTVIMIATTLIACKRNEDSEPVNATDTTVETVDETMENPIDDIDAENTDTDEGGDEVVADTEDEDDDDENIVAVISPIKPKQTTTKKAVTTTTKKNTAQTTTKKPANTNQTTTKKTESTTKKNTATTKKATVTTTKPATKAPTTTKKPVTTTKPATTKAPTTTKHTHNWALVKAAWDEDIYETVHKQSQHTVCATCGLDYTAGYKALGYSSDIAYTNKHVRTPGECYGANTIAKFIPYTEKVYVETIHHPAEYKCTCGATK